MTEPSADVGSDGINKHAPKLVVSDNPSHVESRANTIQEKKDAWAAKRSEIDHIVDYTGRGIDEGIKESVVAFNMNGLNTLISSEGHSDLGNPTPWVVIGAPNMPDVRFVDEDEIYQRIQRERGITEEDIVHPRSEEVRSYVRKAAQDGLNEAERNGPTQEYRRWMEETDEMGHRAEALLDEFYSEREVSEENRLHAHREEDWKRWSIECGDMEEEIKKKSTRTQEENETILLARRAEMLAFTDFLYNIYMSN